MLLSETVDAAKILKIQAATLDHNLFFCLFSHATDAQTVCSSLRLMAAMIQENKTFVKSHLSSSGEGAGWVALSKLVGYRFAKAIIEDSSYFHLFIRVFLLAIMAWFMSCYFVSCLS